MDCYESLNYWTSVAANAATTLGIVGFAVFYFTYQQSQRQFGFTVMLSCIDRFQQLSPLLRGDNDDLSRLKKYVDLTNEEFFYFQRGYIPKEVIVEWMDSIVDFFPIYIKESERPINFEELPFKRIHDEKLLNGYPRLKKAFTLNGQIDLADKAQLIKLIAKNLEITLKDKHFKRAHVI